MQLKVSLSIAVALLARSAVSFTGSSAGVGLTGSAPPKSEFPLSSPNLSHENSTTFLSNVVVIGEGVLATTSLQVSTNGQCSSTTTCLGSSFGSCCSQYGWCGSSSAYCGTGCQPKLGLCTSSSSTLTTTTTAKSIATSSSTIKASTTTTTTTKTTTTTTTTTSSSATSTNHVFAGISAWFLHTQPQSVRLSVLSACQAAGIKTMRIFVRQFTAGSFDYVSGEDNIAVGDVEYVISNSNGTKSVGYDDSVLLLIDQLMLECSQHGVKLIISLHDRWYMGDWEGSDIYTTLYGVSSTNTTALVKFYTSLTGAVVQLDQRITHILSHKNALMGGRTWGQISEGVFSIEAENEAMGNLQSSITGSQSSAWHCARAKKIRSLIPSSSGVLVSTGGGQYIYDSIYPGHFTCPYIDVINIHNYERSAAGYASSINPAIAQAKANGKRVTIEEFGCSLSDGGGTVTGRLNCNAGEIARYQALGLPWAYWAIDGFTDGWREVFVGDPLWTLIVAKAAVTSSSVAQFKWPEVGL